MQLRHLHHAEVGFLFHMTSASTLCRSWASMCLLYFGISLEVNRINTNLYTYLHLILDKSNRWCRARLVNHLRLLFNLIV